MNDNENMLNADGSQVEEQNEGMGIDPVAAEEAEQANEGSGSAVVNDNDPHSVKKRLGMQAKKHQREMRSMKEQLAYLQAQMNQDPNQTTYHPEPTNPYPSPGQPSAPGMGEEERIQRAVRMALDGEKLAKQQAQEAESRAHVSKLYGKMNDDFDNTSDKYEDFDDVVRSHDAPFSGAIRDALLLVDNPGEVAYKLGKNRSELSRIAALHPVDQAKEVNRLSFALMGGKSDKTNTPSANPMSNPRVNPVNSSSAVSDKTPVSAIRARMKSGAWK